MWTDNQKAISEVNIILKQLDELSLNKIPKRILEELEKNSTVDVDYIKPDIPLEDLNLENETKEMLAVISYNYFCNDEERKSWDKLLKRNEIKYQNQLRMKYNPDKIFKNIGTSYTEDTTNTETLKNNSLIKYEESFFKKIWCFIKKWFSRTKNK